MPYGMAAEEVGIPDGRRLGVSSTQRGRIRCSRVRVPKTITVKQMQQMMGCK